MNVTVDAISYEDLASRILDKFANLLNAELCTLWRRIPENGSDKLVLSASVGFERRPGEEPPTYPLQWDAQSNEEIGGVTAWIAVRKQACIANSYKRLANDPTAPWHGSHRGKWDGLQFRMGDAALSFRSLLGVPVCYGKEQNVTAVIKIENSRNPDGFSAADIELTHFLLPFVAAALQTMTKREEYEQNRQFVLKELATALPLLDVTTFHQRVVETIAKQLNADICSLWLVNNDRTQLVLGANYGIREVTEVPTYRLNWSAKNDSEIEGLTPYVAIRKLPFFAGTFEDLKRCEAHKGKWDPIQWRGEAAERFGCLYAVPLLRGEEPIGVLKIENARGNRIFDAVDRATFDVVASFIALAIEMSRRLRSDIVFDFFHLLKQPTTNAVAALQSLREELQLPAPRPQRIKTRLEMVARNLETVHIWAMNVYGLAATPQDVFQSAPSNINLGRLFADLLEEMKRLFPDFTCHLDPQLDTIAYPLTDLQLKKVKVVFFNLFNNSYKYTSDPREIRVDAQQYPGEVILSVRDNGQGIEPSLLDRIWEDYFTTLAPEWPESMGLGLSTVRRLLAELNWSKVVHSEPGKGTCFEITIPLMEGTHDGNGQAEIQQKDAPG